MMAFGILEKIRRFPDSVGHANRTSKNQEQSCTTHNTTLLGTQSVPQRAFCLVNCQSTLSKQNSESDLYNRNEEHVCSLLRSPVRSVFSSFSMYFLAFKRRSTQYMYTHHTVSCIIRRRIRRIIHIMLKISESSTYKNPK
jgi:hypothetical protein